MTVWTNNKVAIRNNLVFGLEVLSESDNFPGEESWTSLESLDVEDIEMIRGLIDYNPSFPWRKEFHQLYSSKLLPPRVSQL